MKTSMPGVHGLVLQRADQLQPGAVADVARAACSVWPPNARCDILPVGRAVEDAAPLLELAHAVGRLLGVQLGHAPVVQVLAARTSCPGSGRCQLSSGVDVAERRRDPALGHHRVRLAEQRLADERRAGAGARRRRSPPAGRRRPRRSRARRSRGARSPSQRILGSSKTPDRREPDVEVGERDPDEADPGPLHVPAVEHGRRGARACAASARRREHVKQSSLPPTRWRSELQPNVNSERQTTLASSTSEPRPTPK